MRCTRRCRGRRCSPEAVERSMWYKVGCTAGDNVLGEHTRGNTWSIAYILSPTLLTVRTQSRFRTYCNLYRLTAFPARQGKARPISVKPQAHTHTVQAASYALKDSLEERVGRDDDTPASGKVAFQIFQTNRKHHRPNRTGRGGASRAEAEARHSLSLSLSYHSCNPCSRAHAAPRPKKTEHRHVEKRENPAPGKPAMCLANLAARERMCQGQKGSR